MAASVTSVSRIRRERKARAVRARIGKDFFPGKDRTDDNRKEFENDFNVLHFFLD